MEFTRGSGESKTKRARDEIYTKYIFTSVSLSGPGCVVAALERYRETGKRRVRRLHDFGSGVAVRRDECPPLLGDNEAVDQNPVE